MARATPRFHLVLTAALPLLLGAAGCGPKQDEKAKGNAETTPQAVVLGAQDLATAHLSAADAGVVVTGSLQPAWIVSVKAQVPGTVQGIRADRGVPVRRGQVLASILAEGLRGQAEGARAAVAAADANLALARQRLESAKTLREAGAMSQIDYQAAQAGYEAAVAQAVAARAQAAGAVEQAGHATLVAPIDGVVGQRKVEEGEAVSPGQELFTVVRSDWLELSGQVPVDEAARVRRGQPVVFTLDAYPGREFRGEVNRIEPMADPQTRQVGIYVRMKNPGTLIGGQFAAGRIVAGQAEQAVVVPETAVRREGTAAYVLVVQGDQVARRTVQVGAANPATGMVPVHSGLKAGERVIVTPAATLPEGTRVQVGASSGGES